MTCPAFTDRQLPAPADATPSAGASLLSWFFITRCYQSKRGLPSRRLRRASSCWRLDCSAISFGFSSIGRERQEADVGAAPAGMLERRALAAAGRAAGALPQLVGRRASTPADHGNGASKRRVMRTRFAVQPHPRRGAL